MDMKPPIFVRKLSTQVRKALEDGLRSSNAFILRRCQILLASARGQIAPRIAENLGCGQQTVRNAIHEFDEKGLKSLTPSSSRPKEVHAAFDEEGAEVLRELLHRSPREFGKASSLWTLEDAAQISFEQGLTRKRVSGETIRATLSGWGCAGSAPSGGSKAPISSTRGKRGSPAADKSCPKQPGVGFGLRGGDDRWSRFEQPGVHSWAEAGEPMRLLQKEASRDDA